VFQLVINAFYDLNLIGLEERANAIGSQASGSVYSTDELGHVWALWLRDLKPDQLPALGPSFEHLEVCLMEDVELDANGARALAALPALKYLLVGLGEPGAEILRLLSQSQSLKLLIVNDCAGPTDISPLGALPHLNTLGIFDDGFSNLDALA